MLQIESDAEPLGPGWKNRGDRFPSHNHNSGDDGIFEEQAQSEKHSAIAETSESCHQKIGAQLGETRPIKNIRFTRRTKAAVHEIEARNNRSLEKCNGNDRS